MRTVPDSTSPARHRLCSLLAGALLLAWLSLLGGCASSTPRMAEVRSFAAESAKLGAYTELTERFRDTYQREKPYLSPAADNREHLLDARRQAACDDFLQLQQGVVAYMRALGTLAGDNQYDLEDQVKAVGGGIKAWPDSGLDDRYVNAFAGLGRLLARQISKDYQDRSVQALVRAGEEPVRQVLDAMRALLRYYDKTSDNEAGIVLGMLETEIAFADTPGQRLLAALGKAQLQNKSAEFRLMRRRFALAEKNLDAIAAGHQQLLLHLDRLDGEPARAALEQAAARVNASRAPLAATP